MIKVLLNYIKIYRVLFDYVLVVFIILLYLKMVSIFVFYLFFKWVDKCILRVFDSWFYSMFDYLICNIYIC